MQYELQVDGYGVTDVGKVRSKNEDSLLLLDRQFVYCVADGMGGVSGGEIASQKVVQCINDQIGNLNESISLSDKVLSIHQAVIEANQWIQEWSGKNEVQGAGTTLVLLVLSNEYPWAVNILHAGDSRAYRYREGQLKQISVDHSIEQAMGDNSGQPLPSQFKGLITNAVGLKKSLSLELTHADQMAGDIWLLCSDGLDKMLSDEAIASILASDDDANTLAQRLVDDANAAGGKDNVSVVIVKALECSRQPEGAVSVPFPGPLPLAPEEDTTSTETTLTSAFSMDPETNGSVVSIETPDSETDFLSHDGDSGIKPVIRWILLALAGVVIVFVLWKIFSRDEATVATETLTVTEVQASAPSDAAVPEAGAVPARPLKEIVTSAEQSGEWNLAYAEMQKGNYSNTDKNMPSKKTIDNWYRKVWMEANRDSGEVNKAMEEFIAAANQVLVSINSNTLPASAPWPKEPSLIANQYCQKRYDIQQMLVEELGEFCTFNSRRINFLKKLSDEYIATAFRAVGSDERKYKESEQRLNDAEDAVKQLEKWLEDWDSLPVSPDQLGALPDSCIQECKLVDDRVDQLVEVLQIKPELKSSGDVDPESELQKELRQVQKEWESIQDDLESLVSGELSPGEERSIRRYLVLLFRFENMVAREESF